jgi:hypothetical protein
MRYEKDFCGVDFIIQVKGGSTKYRLETNIPAPPQIGSKVSLDSISIKRIEVKDVELVVDEDSYWYLVYLELDNVSGTVLDRMEARLEEW